jgi:hypothetical protein
MNPKDDVILALMQASGDLVDLVRGQFFDEVPDPNVWYPCVVYNLASQSPERHIRGSAGVDEARATVEGWALTAADMRAVGEALREALDGQSSTLGSPMWSVALVRSQDGWEQNWQLYRVTQDYVVSLETVVTGT